MAFVFSEEGVIPSAEYSNSKWVVLPFPRMHLKPQRVRSAADKWLRTLLRSLMLCSYPWRR